MKKNILSIAILFLSLTAMSQSKEYFQVMGETLGGFQNCKTIDDFQALGNKFSLISNSEQAEWLPLYYHAQCYIIMSFMETTDVAKKDAYLDVAEKSLEKMLTLAPAESEIYALQAMFYSARLVVDPMTRGQQYGALSGQAVGKALALDANNPRAKFIKLQNDMGTAQFFGNDPKAFCPKAKELLEKWDEFKPKSPLHPKWGKQQVAGIVESCK